MKINRLWILLLGFACFALCGSSLAQEPQGIFLPENSHLVWAVVGEGVQIYEAKANPAGGYQWTLKMPEAELKDLSGQLVGSILPGRVGLPTMEARSWVPCRR
jgi:hypothetical protein